MSIVGGARMEPDDLLQIRANREVFYRLGQPFVLLGVSGIDGGGNGNSLGVFGKPVLAGHI